MAQSQELNWMNVICKPYRKFLPEKLKNHRDQWPLIWKKVLTKQIKVGLREKVTILAPDNLWDQTLRTMKPSWKPCVTTLYQPGRISWQITTQQNLQSCLKFWKRIVFSLSKLICSGMRLRGKIYLRLDCWMPLSLRPFLGRLILGCPPKINNSSSILSRVARETNMKQLMLRVLKVRITRKIQNLKLDNWTSLSTTTPRTTMRRSYLRQ